MLVPKMCVSRLESSYSSPFVSTFYHLLHLPNKKTKFYYLIVFTSFGHKNRTRNEMDYTKRIEITIGKSIEKTPKYIDNFVFRVSIMKRQFFQ
jgi:hypothetical protein